MPEASKNPVVRLLVPLLLLIIGGVGAWVVMSSQSRSGPASPTNQPAANQPAATQPATAQPAAQPTDPGVAGGSPAQPAPASDAASEHPKPAGDASASTPAAPANATPTAQPAPPGLRARMFPAGTYTPIGDPTPKDKGGKHELAIEFSPIGAGFQRVRLSNHFTSIKRTENQTVQAFAPLPGSDRIGLTAFAADSVEVEGVKIPLWATDAANADRSFWREVAPGSFEAIIEDAGGAEVLRLTRTLELREGSHEFVLRQRIENLGQRPLNVRFSQFGPMDLPMAMIRYGGDVRRVRFGYLLPPTLDPEQIVQGGDSGAALYSHHAALGDAQGTLPGTYVPAYLPKALWPNADSTRKQLTLVWGAMTDRYFAAAVHMPGLAPGETPTGSGVLNAPPQRALTAAESVDRVAIAVLGGGERGSPVGVVALRLNGAKTSIAPGATADVSVAGYFGPMSRAYISAQPQADRVGLDRLVLFTFGGPCGFCTFQWLAWGLRGFMGFLHDRVFFDWSLAIMFLVVCVRSLLHPVTRWAQTNMIRFGKHMGKLAPKQKAIQEKFGDDPIKMREEIARLMREEHVSYSSGAMGCLPMFLQMPVWIALYAMLYFTFEMRHEHAFYGVVQAITGHSWGFLGDLAEPDNFLPFGTAIWIPLLSQLMGPIEGLNILPLVMGVVFYIQQKYMTPPTTVQASPEIEQQQKIAKVMMVVMMPLFMYNAPSGLALYFLTNSTLGILESKWIRARAEKLVEAEDRKRDEIKAQRKAKGEPEKEGFMARVQRMVEEQQKIREAQKKALERKLRK